MSKERFASGSSGSSWPSEQWFGNTVGRIPGANLACMRTAAGLLGRAPKKSLHPVQAPEESIIGQDSLSLSPKFPRATLLTRCMLDEGGLTVVSYILNSLCLDQ